MSNVNGCKIVCHHTYCYKKLCLEKSQKVCKCKPFLIRCIPFPCLNGRHLGKHAEDSTTALPSSLSCSSVLLHRAWHLLQASIHTYSLASFFFGSSLTSFTTLKTAEVHMGFLGWLTTNLYEPMSLATK